MSGWYTLGFRTSVTQIAQNWCDVRDGRFAVISKPTNRYAVAGVNVGALALPQREQLTGTGGDG
jgi:hypothetical protein